MKKVMNKLYLSLGICALAFTVGSTSLYAEDIEIYSTSASANVLFVIDVSGSMNERASGSSGPTRLEVLQDAFRTVLSRNWENLNVGVADFGDFTGSGIDFPVRDVNALAQSIEPQVTDSTKTYAELLIDVVDAYQPRSSSARTPTVEALYEAALYFRGDAVFDGVHPDVDPALIWNNATSMYDGGWRSAGLRTHDGTLNPNGRGDWCHRGARIPGQHSQCGSPATYHASSCRSYTTQSNCTGGGCRLRDSTGECVSYFRQTCDTHTGERCRKVEPRWQNANYISPITDQCDNNYIVLLSDGGPTEDENSVRNRIEDLYDPDLSDCGDLGSGFSIQINDGVIEKEGECGPDLTRFLRDNDQIPGITDSFVTTHTVGFALSGAELQARNYLELLASEGGGNFYNASTQPGNLADQLENLLTSLEAKPRSISTPIATIDLGNPLSTREEIYYTQFAAKNTARWPGNVKGYYLGPRTTPPADPTVAIRDINQDVAVDANGDFLDSSRSFWTSGGNDGSDVTLGGFAAKLNPNARTLFTDNDDPNPNLLALTGLAKANFDETDTGLFNLIATGNATNDHAAVDELVDWARGVDVDDEDGDGSVTDPRAEAGDPLHSVPLVAQYASGPARVLYAMTNEGYIHAIDVSANDASGGDELFAYMPSELLANLDTLRLNTDPNKVYGLDGPLELHQPDGVLDTAGDKYLYFGMRRGGKNYYSLDVTDSSAPELRWKIKGGVPGDFEELAQTWSRPTPATVRINATTLKKVLIFGGGYDVDQDTNAQRAADDEGRAVYIVDESDGSLIWSAGYNTTNFDYDLGLQNSIPGGIAVIDLNADGIHDRLYFGDTGGRLWRIDLGEVITSSSGYMLADLAEDGSNANNRRFYTEPSVTRLRNGQLGITIGSGYRAHPLNTEVQERTYMIYDSHPSIGDIPSSFTPIIDGTGANAVEDITSNFNFDPNAPAANRNGWKIEWPVGTKVMTNINAVRGILNFSVYQPPVTGACAGEIGQSQRLRLNINGRPIGQPDSFYTTPGNTVIDSGVMVANTLWGDVRYYSLPGDNGLGIYQGGIPDQPGKAPQLNTRFWLNLDTLDF